jgi:hypothetical protein
MPECRRRNESQAFERAIPLAWQKSCRAGSSEGQDCNLRHLADGPGLSMRSRVTTCATLFAWIVIFAIIGLGALTYSRLRS